MFLIVQIATLAKLEVLLHVGNSLNTLIHNPMFPMSFTHVIISNLIDMFLKLIFQDNIPLETQVDVFAGFSDPLPNSGASVRVNQTTG